LKKSKNQKEILCVFYGFKKCFLLIFFLIFFWIFPFDFQG